MPGKTKHGRWIEEEDHGAIVQILDDAIFAYTRLPQAARNSAGWRDLVRMAYQSRIIDDEADADPDVVADVLEEIDPRLGGFPEVPTP
jgi:hypothetical protein